MEDESELKQRIVKLEDFCSTLLATNVILRSEIRALQVLSIEFWQRLGDQKVEKPDFSRILVAERNAQIEHFLSTYADTNMISASALKNTIDSILKQ